MDLKKELLGIIKDYPDFPKAGIVFKDICPLLADAKTLKRVVRHMAEHAHDCGANQIIGMESRGFLFGVPLALELGVPFVPARKKGKLPGPVVTESYALEYGMDHLEIQAAALTPGSRNLIVDDVIATGGTAAAVGRLVSKQNATIAGYSFLLELGFLNGRSELKTIAPDAGIYSILVL